MAERDIMEYISYKKCTFISDTHVIFDIDILRKVGDDEPVCRCNVIINEQLDDQWESIISANSSIDDMEEIKKESRRAEKECIEKAKWIFSGMDNDIDNEN